MIEIGGKADVNDIEYAKRLVGELVAVLPAPYRRGGEIHPNVTRFLLPNGNLAEVFHVKPIYYRHINGQWRPLSEVTVHHGNRKIHLNDKWTDIEPAFLNWLIGRQALLKNGELLIPSPVRLHGSPVRLTKENLLFTSQTFYPNAHTESVSVDGSVYTAGTSSWSQARDATTGYALIDSGTTSRVFSLYYHPSLDWNVHRQFLLFDSSSIGGSSTITSGTLSIYRYNSGDSNDYSASTSTYKYFNCFSSSPASNNALALDDFDQVGSTKFCDTNVSVTSGSVPSVSQYTDMTLNASGISNISKTSISKFSLRSGWDIDNVDIREGASAIRGSGILLYNAEEAGTSYDPKLFVEWTAGTAYQPRAGMSIGNPMFY